MAWSLGRSWPRCCLIRKTTPATPESLVSETSNGRPNKSGTLNGLAALYVDLGEPLPPKYPLYGRDAHRTRAGVHADGLNKFWWM